MGFLLKRRVDTGWESREVTGPALTIGRSAAADVKLDDPAVGLEHAVVRQAGNIFVLFDNQSLTGTYVNGRRIQRASLEEADRIAIGLFSLEVQPSDSPDTLVLQINEVPHAGAGEALEDSPTQRDYQSSYALEFRGFNKSKLTLSLVTLGVISLAGLLIAGKQSIFRPGPVSAAHSFIAESCSECHVGFRGPSPQLCEGCHQGPRHHANQVADPPCVDCHVEHRALPRVALVDNRQCNGCHSDLKTLDPATKQAGPASIFAKKVTDFAKDHPQFSITVPSGESQARVRLDRVENEPSAVARFQGHIALNHRIHLQKPIEGPRREPVQLDCSSCHLPATDGLRMRPITFKSHCAECHERDIEIGSRAGSDKLAACRVPHGSVKRVHEYLQLVFAESLCKPFPFDEPEPRLLVSPRKPDLSPSLAERIRSVEEELFRDKCALCHRLDRSGPALPEVVNPIIPVVWFRAAKFSHKSHLLLDCVECHIDRSKSLATGRIVNAKTSEETADVLMPGIETCRTCHKSSDPSLGVQSASAPTFCASCHNYHDKKMESRAKRTRMLKEFK